jgi:hypothetical protein
MKFDFYITLNHHKILSFFQPLKNVKNILILLAKQNQAVA